MSKKMKIPSIFKNRDAKAQPWQWPSCAHPKTLSFRASDDVFKTVNSVFLDLSDEVETPDSWFTSSSECPSFSTDAHSEDNNSSGPESLEMIINRLRMSERLFFEPRDTSSILKENKTSSTDSLPFQESGTTQKRLAEPDDTEKSGSDPFKESVALALESEDPYLDFKKSMQEMVESHGLRDWECLEELLGWYLKMNGKMNHGFIVGAFVDLLVELGHDSCASSSTAVCRSDSTSYSSAGSSFSSPPSPLSPTLAVAVHEMAISEEGDDEIVHS